QRDVVGVPGELRAPGDVGLAAVADVIAAARPRRSYDTEPVVKPRLFPLDQLAPEREDHVGVGVEVDRLQVAADPPSAHADAFRTGNVVPLRQQIRGGQLLLEPRPLAEGRPLRPVAADGQERQARLDVGPGVREDGVLTWACFAAYHGIILDAGDT